MSKTVKTVLKAVLAIVLSLIIWFWILCVKAGIGMQFAKKENEEIASRLVLHEIDESLSEEVE